MSLGSCLALCPSQDFADALLNLADGQFTVDNVELTPDPIVVDQWFRLLVIDH